MYLKEFEEERLVYRLAVYLAGFVLPGRKGGRRRAGRTGRTISIFHFSPGEVEFLSQTGASLIIIKKTGFPGEFQPSLGSLIGGCRNCAPRDH